MLTSAARETLLGVESVIVDEIHALAPTKRGAHLALTLERLEHLISSQEGWTPDRTVQRIGLSATQRPLEVVAGFLGGPGPPAAVTIVDAGMRKELDLSVVVPVDDMGALGQALPAPPLEEPGALPLRGPQRASIWPSMHPELLALVESHRSTLVFVNARRLAERLASRLNELALEQRDDDADAAGDAGPRYAAAEAVGTSAAEGEELVKAHHGSLSRERRLLIEDELKRGDLRGLVATSSLELGIDMGAVDLVVQVESPGSVASGLQRIGRAGHQVGAPSRGRIFPKHRADLLEAAVVVQRMRDGLIEHTRMPGQPARRAGPADRRRVRARRVAGRRAVRAVPLAPRTTRACPGSCSTTPSTCWPVATRPRSSPSCGPGWCGTAWRAPCEGERARSGWRSPRVAPSPTVGCTACSCPTAPASASWTRRWSTSPGWARPSCWAPRRGASRTSPSSGWSSRPAPGQPGKMPFWHGDGPGRRGRARPGPRRVRPHRALDARRPGARAPAHRARAGRARRCQRGRLPGRAGRGHRCRARRPHARGRALPRRDRRLAHLHALAVRCTGPRTVGHDHPHPSGRPLRRRRRPGHVRRRGALEPTTASSSDCPRQPTTCRPTCCCSTPTRSRPRSSPRCRPTAAFAARFREASARALLLPASTPGPAHPAVAATSAGRRPAGGRLALPQLPDPAGGHPRVLQRRVRPAGAAPGADRDAQSAHPCGARRDAGRVAVRPVAAVRLDRGVHVRGRRPARRTPRRGAVARPGAAARPARRGGAAVAARRRGRRPGRAGAPAPDPRARGARRRRGARPAARARPAQRRRAGRRASPRPCCRRSTSGSPSCSSDAASSRSASRASGGWPRPRTRPACATRWAWPSRWVCRRCTPTRSTRRCATWSSGSPAPTDPSPPHSSPVDWVWRTRWSASRSPTWRPTGGWSRASSARVAARASGVDAEVLRQLRRRSLAALRKEVAPGRRRRRWPASCRAWQGIGSTRRGSRRAGRGRRRAPGRAVPASLLEARRARRCAWASTAPPTWTCSAPPARSSGSGPARWAPTTVGCGWCSATRWRRWCRRRPIRRAGLDEAPPRRAARPPAGARRVVLGRPGRRGRRGAAALRRRDGARRRCGTWSGRARSPTTRWPRCGPRSRAGASRRASGARSRRPQGGSSRRFAAAPPPARPAAAGRWSSTAPLFAAPAVADRVHHPAGAAAAGALRRADPGDGPRRGGRGRLRRACTRCSSCSRSAGRFAAATSSTGSARPSSPSRERSTCCAPRARTRSGPTPTRSTASACRGSRRPTPRPRPTPGCWPPPTRPSPTALRCAWPESAGHPARAVGAYVVLVDGARVRLPGARRQAAAHLPAAADAPAVGRRAGRPGRVRPGAAPAHRVDRRRAAASLARGPTRCARSGFVDGYKGLSLGT